jgi:hypothetical protein
MVSADHLYTEHHTYTGKGCAHCGKTEAEHQSKGRLVNGKEEKPD